MKRCLLLLLPSWCAACARPESADLMLTGGVVWTGEPGGTTTGAVAVRGTRVVAVGTVAEVRERIGTYTSVIELNGRMVVPG